MARMLIHYVCGNPYYSLNDASGYATHISELSKALETHGAGVKVFLPNDQTTPGRQKLRTNSTAPSRFRKFLPEFMKRVLRDLKRTRSDFIWTKEYRRFASKAPPEIIYERLDFTGAIALEAASEMNTPYFLEIHGPLNEEATTFGGGSVFFRSYFNQRIRSALMKAQGIVCVSSVIQNWLVEMGIAKDKILVLANGASEIFLETRRVRLDGSPIVIGFVGSDLPWHGLPTLIHAFSDLVCKNPQINARLRVVGQASQNVELRDLVQRLGLEALVDWVKPVERNQIPRILATFDIGVMPSSNHYGSPIKLFEYAAMGIAMIAPRVRPVEDVFQDQENCLLIEPNSSSDLFHKLQALVGNADLRDTLGRNARDLILKHYTWSTLSEDLLKFFQKKPTNVIPPEGTRVSLPFP